MEIDRKSFLASLGGAATLNRMSDEAKADALEDQMLFQLSQGSASARSGEGGHEFPTAAEVDEQVETLPYRRGVGSLFVNPRGNVKKLPPMPATPTLVDFFTLRFLGTANHVLMQSREEKRHVGGNHSGLPAARHRAGHD